jgi:hypothetical protein
MRKAMSEWISVKDGLPIIKLSGFLDRECPHVLTYEISSTSRPISMPIKVNYIQNYKNKWAYGKSENITHWMPLPEVPK